MKTACLIIASIFFAACFTCAHGENSLLDDLLNAVKDPQASGQPRRTLAQGLAALVGNLTLPTGGVTSNNSAQVEADVRATIKSILNRDIAAIQARLQVLVQNAKAENRPPTIHKEAPCILASVLAGANVTGPSNSASAADWAKMTTALKDLLSSNGAQEFNAKIEAQLTQLVTQNATAAIVNAVNNAANTVGAAVNTAYNAANNLVNSIPTIKPPVLPILPLPTLKPISINLFPHFG